MGAGDDKCESDSDSCGHAGDGDEAAEAREFLRDVLRGQPKASTEHIRWDDVARVHSGIELIPFDREAQEALAWYRAFDVPSGVIWRTRCVLGWKRVATRLHDGSYKLHMPRESLPPSFYYQNVIFAQHHADGDGA